MTTMEERSTRAAELRQQAATNDLYVQRAEAAYAETGRGSSLRIAEVHRQQAERKRALADSLERDSLMIQLSADLKERLRKRAFMEGLTITQVVIAALEAYLGE